jgi:hypothetical protein
MESPRSEWNSFKRFNYLSPQGFGSGGIFFALRLQIPLKLGLTQITKPQDFHIKCGIHFTPQQVAKSQDASSGEASSDRGLG